MLETLRSLLRTRMTDAREAQGFVEYALIMAGVSAATQVAMQNMGQQVADVFNSISDVLRSS